MTYDLAIIGAGAAGIAAAKKAVSCKLKTVLIQETRDFLGGTCLNQGCIPAKLYLNQIPVKKDFSPVFDLKNRIVEGMKKDILDYLERNGVTFAWGRAKFLDENTVEISSGARINAKNFIVAAGSLPVSSFTPDGEKLIFAQDIFRLSRLPRKCMIIGAGSVGIEIACILNDLSGEVTVVEKENSILSHFPKNITGRLKRILVKKGIEIKTGVCAGPEEFNNFDLVILAMGRKPNTYDLGLDRAGVSLDARGRIVVDKHLRASGNIYACGDVTSEKMYAYLAEYQADLAVENIAGAGRETDYTGVADCVFSHPQISRVGLTQEQAAEQGIDCDVFRTGFLRFSPAYVYDDRDGYLEIVADKRTGRILGAAIISRMAGELISLFSLGLRGRITVSQLKTTIFIHPTLSEIISQALR